MYLVSTKTLRSILVFLLSSCTAALAVCPVDEVVVKGHVIDPPSNAKVLVQLVYANNVVGESGDTTLDGEKFTLPLDFLTESRRPIVNRSFGKCSRRPTTVIVRLAGGENSHSYDTVSLDFAKDFRLIYGGTYALKSDLVLNSPH